MKRTQLVVTLGVLAALTSSVAAGLKPFSCPSYESNKDPMMTNQTLLGGLWFEYVYSESYKGGNAYDCASWTMLAPGNVSDTAESYEFDVIFHAINRTTNKTIYNNHK